MLGRRQDSGFWREERRAEEDAEGVQARFGGRVQRGARGPEEFERGGERVQGEEVQAGEVREGRPEETEAG